jgi:hypothetical protein
MRALLMDTAGRRSRSIALRNARTSCLREMISCAMAAWSWAATGDAAAKSVAGTANTKIFIASPPWGEMPSFVKTRRFA